MRDKIPLEAELNMKCVRHPFRKGQYLCICGQWFCHPICRKECECGAKKTIPKAKAKVKKK